MTDIKISGLSKSFEGKEVLRDFSVTFPAGEISVIMGGSGCGKTTLLNILLGLERPDGGIIEGLENVTPSAVFQEDCLCEDFGAVTNIRAVCTDKLSRADAEQALLSLGLERADLYTPVRTLSGGMKRRVALARALLYGGDQLVLDEPFTGLDTDNRARAVKFILERRGGRTTLVVTHGTADAEALGAAKILTM